MSGWRQKEWIPWSVWRPEYGRQLLEPQTGLEVRQGRLSTEEMQELFEREGRPLVLDVTHPYASVVSENIHAACEKTGCRYLRLIRPSVSVQEREADRDDLVVMDSVEEAVDWLSRNDRQDSHDDRQQGAFQVYEASGIPGTGLCKGAVHAGGGTPVYGTRLYR